MTLTLYFHPFSSYCQKAVIALDETATPFTGKVINLQDPASVGELKAVWPLGKFPVLRDDARNRSVAESSIIIEYLDHFYPGAVKLIPADPDLAHAVRAKDRFFDLYISDPMSKIVTDTFRPEGTNDPHGVAQSQDLLRKAYDILETGMANKTYAMGEAFTMADIAAAPALFYADLVMPLADAHPHTAAYLDRLMKRPSFTRALREAQPFHTFFPYADRYMASFNRLAV